jgi:hypothetical protein
MRALLLALAVLVLSDMSPEQDDFISENTSSSVRPTKAEALPQVDALDLEALARREDKWISVRDKVHSTHLANSQKICTLNLGPNWQTCFNGVILTMPLRSGMVGFRDSRICLEGKWYH